LLDSLLQENVTNVPPQATVGAHLAKVPLLVLDPAQQ